MPETEELVTITQAEHALMSHALGIKHGSVSYRNHYVVTPGTPHAKMWGSLCERGLAEDIRDGSATDNPTAFHTFRVTDSGVRAVRMFGVRDGLGNPISAAGVYYVQDTRAQVGNCTLFWAKERAGYVCDLDEAGIYRGTEVATMRETDIAWPVDHILNHVVRHVRVEGLMRTKQHVTEQRQQAAARKRLKDADRRGQ